MFNHPWPCAACALPAGIHEQGGRKGCPKQAEYMVVLNKADQSFEEMQREILRQLDPSYLKTVSMTWQSAQRLDTLFGNFVQNHGVKIEILAGSLREKEYNILCKRLSH